MINAEAFVHRHRWATLHLPCLSSCPISSTFYLGNKISCIYARECTTVALSPSDTTKLDLQQRQEDHSGVCGFCCKHCRLLILIAPQQAVRQKRGCRTLASVLLSSDRRIEIIVIRTASLLQSQLFYRLPTTIGISVSEQNNTSVDQGHLQDVESGRSLLQRKARVSR